MIYLCLNLIGAETTMINYEVLRRKKVILRARSLQLGYVGGPTVQRSDRSPVQPSSSPASSQPCSSYYRAVCSQPRETINKLTKRGWTIDKPTKRRNLIAEIRSIYSIQIDDKGGFGREHDANRIMFIWRVSLLLSVAPHLLQRYRSDVTFRGTKIKTTTLSS